MCCRNLQQRVTSSHSPTESHPNHVSPNHASTIHYFPNHISHSHTSPTRLLLFQLFTQPHVFCPHYHQPYFIPTRSTRPPSNAPSSTSQNNTNPALPHVSWTLFFHNKERDETLAMTTHLCLFFLVDLYLL